MAYAKQEKLNNQNTVPLSANGKKKHIQRGKTLTNVRVQRGTSTEQKVAHRLSVTMQQHNPESLHIRSFSLPKEQTSQITDEQLAHSPSLETEQKTPSTTYQDRVLQANDSKHSSHPTITITPAMAPNTNGNDQDINDHSNNNNNNKKNNKTIMNNLPSSTVNNMVGGSEKRISSNSQIQLNVENKYSSHISTVSDTHTIKSESSETVYTENTEYTKDEESQCAYTTSFFLSFFFSFFLCVQNKRTLAIS